MTNLLPNNKSNRIAVTLWNAIEWACNLTWNGFQVRTVKQFECWMKTVNTVLLIASKDKGGLESSILHAAYSRILQEYVKEFPPGKSKKKEGMEKRKYVGGRWKGEVDEMMKGLEGGRGMLLLGEREREGRRLCWLLSCRVMKLPSSSLAFRSKTSPQVTRAFSDNHVSSLSPLALLRLLSILGSHISLSSYASPPALSSPTHTLGVQTWHFFSLDSHLLQLARFIGRFLYLLYIDNSS